MDNIDNEIDIEIHDIMNEIDSKDMKSLNSQYVHDLKMKMLSKIPLDENTETMQRIYKRLEHYKFVDELDELKLGCYYQWINVENIIKTHDVKLVDGGFLFDYRQSADETDVILKLHKGGGWRNMTRKGRLMVRQVGMNKILLFQN